jgi:hypothetical protein
LRLRPTEVRIFITASWARGEARAFLRAVRKVGVREDGREAVAAGEVRDATGPGK